MTAKPLGCAWPFIAGDATKTQLDGSVGIHKEGELVSGLEWMGQDVGRDGDHYKGEWAVQKTPAPKQSWAASR